MDAHTAQAMRDHIFISYSRADREWLDRLNTFLRPLKRAEKIVVWDDSAIKASDVWRAEIQEGLDRACIAILLVSANFFASDFIDAVELPALLQAAQEGGVKILSVIIGPSRFERTALYQFQAANDPRRPLNSLPSHEVDATLQQVANMCEDLFAPATAPQDVVAARPGRPGTRARVVPAATRSSEAPLDTSRPITLLHVSDPQFGRNHRFGNLALPPPDDTFDTLLARLRDDLQYLEREHGLRPDLVVLSGDLAEWGLKPEFDDLLPFVEGLIQLLKLPQNRVVMIPGNHDVNRKACEAYFNNCEADGEKPVAPFWPKWRHYAQFFHRFYRDCPDITFTETEPWTLFAMPELKLVVAGLNSTMRESHQAEDHYGYLGEAQLRWFADKLAPYRQQGWLRIAALHHNIRRGPVADDENLRDAEELQRWLGPSVNLILHGHTHDGRLDWLTPTIPILSTGSAAVVQNARPEEIPNQYQIIQIWRDRCKRWARAFEPRRKGWIGDNRASGAGDDWRDEQPVAFEDVGGTFPSPEVNLPATARLDFREFPDLDRELRGVRHDDFLSRVERVCRLREPGLVEVQPQQAGAPPVDYLRVTVKQDSVVLEYPVGVSEHGIDEQVLERFLTVHRRYRETDPGVRSWLVYGGEPASPDFIQRAGAQRIRLMSFVEYQGLLDFRTYVREQTRRLECDPLYVPEFYVPQRLRYQIGQETQSSEDALATLQGWLAEPYGRFVLILGDFGTGKTFLLQQLARLMGAESGVVTPILIQMRALEKGHGLDTLVAMHLAQAGMERIELKAFRYMLEQGRIALLFDGFDELALRVTYSRAADHLRTLIEAASGDARVVVTSRTQHFLSDQQIKTALYEQVERLPNRRIVSLEPFDTGRIRQFLVNRLRDTHQADSHLPPIFAARK